MFLGKISEERTNVRNMNSDVRFFFKKDFQMSSLRSPMMVGVEKNVDFTAFAQKRDEP